MLQSLKKIIDNFTLNKIKSIYIVPVPIGNILDISIRSLLVLKNVDIIISEDTRKINILLNNFSIKNKTICLNNFNEKIKFKYLVNKFKYNNIALVSDSGTPLINDPGFNFINYAIKNNIIIVPLPGPCAAITALSVSGLSTNKFCYEGFIPKKILEKRKLFISLKNEKRTIIFYETSNRILNSLYEISNIFDLERKIVIAKDLTKKWEFIYRNSLNNLLLDLKSNKLLLKGEITILLEGKINFNYNINNIFNIFNILNKKLSNKDSIKIISEIYNINKNFLYKNIINKKSNN